jgi:hypothetical protein
MTDHCSVNPVLVEAFLMKADGKPRKPQAERAADGVVGTCLRQLSGQAGGLRENQRPLLARTYSKRPAGYPSARSKPRLECTP